MENKTSFITKLSKQGKSLRLNVPYDIPVEEMEKLKKLHKERKSLRIIVEVLDP